MTIVKNSGTLVRHFMTTKNLNRAVKHAALRIFHKCENSHLCLSCLLPLQPLMEKPSSSR
ncbi:hypothetical protein GHT06_009960 [Daphnia sinensis]|uniref:Uncharacterized protein n=1 Tax=Daphnia sinensis TaxID=1820382 RepID=A0AAD5PWK2_9CRUS|nr:hypothetical protein GHT06_005384 [Daphnia sinensis]KAI9562516.1 hypothetical protein GHT06_009960 [Daphnia sinensis]